MTSTGRSPADWDQDTWDGLREIFKHAWTLEPPACMHFAAYLYAAGLVMGASVQAGPLMSWELREMADQVANESPEPLRSVVRKAALTTQGDRDGLSDLAMALRDASEVCKLLAQGKLRKHIDAETAFHTAKAQMLGVVKMAPEHWAAQ